VAGRQRSAARACASTIGVDDLQRDSIVKPAISSPAPSAGSINKSLVLLHGVFRLAVRQHGLRTNPVAAAERQPEHRTGDFRVAGSTSLRAGRSSPTG
jgi:hypothetical protein